MAGHKEDERFAHILSDPKLQQIKLKEQKTKVDKRFQSLIASSKSKQKCLIDKRGRPVTAVSEGGLSRFYDLSDSEEDERGTTKTIRSKGEKEKNILEKKDKKEKQEKANKVKEEKKERNILEKKSDDEEEDEEQTDEEQEMEMDVAEEVEDVDETEEDEEEGTEEDEEADDDDSDDSEDEEDEEEDKSSSKRHKKKKGDISPDYSRGIGNISSSSDEEDDDEDRYSGEVEDSQAKGPVAAIHPWAEMIEKEVPVVDQSTKRLAICNMNWDYVTAQDLMVLCNSFKPQHGTVFSVTIYPTEFGIERMREEYKKGPKEITEVKQSTAESTTQTATKAEAEEIESTNAGPSKKKANKVTKEKQSTEKKDGKNSEMVRRYELNRLRYFFAVVECDSVETADQIYTNCDGMEFEKSGTKLDFRYIPDDETFDYEPKSIATSLPASGTYKPPHFVDAAVSRTDVKLSWDKTSHRRLAVTQMDFRKVKNIDELEDQFQEYIAPYTSEEEEEEEGEEPYPGLDWSYIPGELPAKKDVQNMKSTLLELKEEDKTKDLEEEESDEEEQKSDDDQVHMEFSWDIGLKDSLEGAAKQKKKETENAKLTPWEQYQKNKKDKKRQKEREKKRKGKAEQKKESGKIKETSVELDSFFLPDEPSDEEKEKPKRQKESLKKRAKRRKREADEQRLEVDQSVLADPRFADLAKKDFALDPSAPEFRKRRRKF